MMTPTQQKKVSADSYVEAIGRRKTAIARVRLSSGGKGFMVEDKDLQEYLKEQPLIRIASQALDAVSMQGSVGISVHVYGGGIHAQAEAIRHGIAHALVLINPDYRKLLRDKGFLTRDSRMKERRKFGLKKARRAPQWSKR